MTASSDEGLQRIMEALERISEEYGMRINPVSYTHLTLPTNREV